MTDKKLDGFKTLTEKEREIGSYYRRSHIMVDRTLNYPPIVKVPLWHRIIHSQPVTTETSDNPMKTYYAVYERGADDGSKYFWYNYKGDKE